MSEKEITLKKFLALRVIYYGVLKVKNMFWLLCTVLVNIKAILLKT